MPSWTTGPARTGRPSVTASGSMPVVSGRLGMGLSVSAEHVGGDTGIPADVLLLRPLAQIGGLARLGNERLDS